MILSVKNYINNGYSWFTIYGMDSTDDYVYTVEARDFPSVFYLAAYTPDLSTRIAEYTLSGLTTTAPSYYGGRMHAKSDSNILILEASKKSKVFSFNGTSFTLIATNSTSSGLSNPIGVKSTGTYSITTNLELESFNLSGVSKGNTLPGFSSLIDISGNYIVKGSILFPAIMHLYSINGAGAISYVTDIVNTYASQQVLFYTPSIIIATGYRYITSTLFSGSTLTYENTYDTGAAEITNLKKGIGYIWFIQGSNLCAVSYLNGTMRTALIKPIGSGNCHLAFSEKRQSVYVSQPYELGGTKDIVEYGIESFSDSVSTTWVPGV